MTFVFDLIPAGQIDVAAHIKDGMAGDQDFAAQSRNLDKRLVETPRQAAA